MKCDLGCGKRWPEGFIGIDKISYGQTYVLDLERQAMPFETETIEFIRAHNFFEHTNEYIRILNECWRVLKKGGVIDIIVPDITKSLDVACGDPTHKSYWCGGRLKYLTGEKPRNADYGIKPWIVLENKAADQDERCRQIKLTPKK